MNKVILTGRLTRDPESRLTQGNLEITRFSLAVSNDFVNKDGERETEFINCVAFNRLAGTIGKYCKKGTLISVQGRVKNGSYEDKEGNKRYTTDIVCESMEFLGSKSGSSSNDYTPTNNSGSDIETTDLTEDPYKNFGEEITLSSDDLPF